MFLNRCIWTPTAGGLADFVVSAAAQSGYRPVDCINPVVANGGTYDYFAISGAQHEEGTGIYTASTTTLTRATIRNSSAGGAKVNFSSVPVVFMGPAQAKTVREVIQANRTYYVRAGGANSATHSGLTNVNGDALLTFQYLYDNIISYLDFNGFTVTMQGDATSLAGIVVAAGTGIPWVGAGTLVVDNGGGGLTTNPADGTGAFGAYSPLSGTMVIQNAVVTSTGASGFNVGLMTFGGHLQIGTGVTIGACDEYHRYVDEHGSIYQGSPLTISGNTFVSLYVATGSYVGASTETISGAITVSGAYLVIDSGVGFINNNAISYVNPGNVTGQKFFIGTNCQYYDGSALSSLTGIPGTIDGMLMAGSRYNDWPYSYANTFTGAGNITMKPGEFLTIVQKGTGAATQVTLPQWNTLTYGNFAFLPFTIKDGKGDAATNNITVVAPNSGTINGLTSYIINRNYGSVTIFQSAINSDVWFTTVENDGHQTLLTQGSVSNVATLDLVLTAYTRFKAIDIYLYYFQPVTSAAQLTMRISTDGGSTYLTAASYWHASLLGSLGGGGFAQGSSTATAIALNPNLGNPGDGNGGAFMRITLWNQTKQWWVGIDWMGGGYMAGGDYRSIMGSGFYFNTTQDVDAVRFLMSTGNISAGDYAVYGRP